MFTAKDVPTITCCSRKNYDYDQFVSAAFTKLGMNSKEPIRAGRVIIRLKHI